MSNFPLPGGEWGGGIREINFLTHKCILYYCEHYESENVPQPWWDIERGLSENSLKLLETDKAIGGLWKYAMMYS